jgi:radical SAM superfamily enzyme YgiQ (UPF0313 family)
MSGRRARVLLIAPRITGVRNGVNRMQPGLGIGYLAGVLKSRGHEVAIFDAALEGSSRQTDTARPDEVLIGVSDEELLARIAAFRPDVVALGVSFSTLADEAMATARIVRRWNPKVPVVVGGAHVNGVVTDYLHASRGANRGGLTALRRSRVMGEYEGNSAKLRWRFDAMNDGSVDYGMIGECDFAFADLVEALVDGRSTDEIPGLVTFGPEPRFNHTRPNVDITALPNPARELVNMEGYFAYGKFHSSMSSSNRVLNVMASRGCPEACSFCATPDTWGNSVRWRDPRAIYEEIRGCIDRYGIEEIQFEDDSLTARIAPLTELCNLLEPLKLPWCTPNGVKVNYHLGKQRGLFEAMKRSGCYQVTFACESGVQRVLDDIIGKRLKVEQAPIAIENAKRAGLFAHSFWMVGFPGETRAEMQETVERAMECGADSVSFAIVTPLPGTPLYRKVVEENLWWPGVDGHRGTNFRRSQVAVDGFDSADEFEKWVATINAQVNRAAAERDPERATRRRSMVKNQAVAGSLAKQT